MLHINLGPFLSKAPKSYILLYTVYRVSHGKKSFSREARLLFTSTASFSVDYLINKKCESKR